MPNLKRLLSRFDRSERDDIRVLITKITSLDWRGLDIKKLKGYRDIFRLRKGDLRIIYRVQEKAIFILAIERRSEGTYKF